MLEELPGLTNTPFYIKFESVDWFNKKDVLEYGTDGQKVEVLKIYRNTWWRKLLLWLGFKVRIFELKVKSIQC